MCVDAGISRLSGRQGSKSTIGKSEELVDHSDQMLSGGSNVNVPTGGTNIVIYTPDVKVLGSLSSYRRKEEI